MEQIDAHLRPFLVLMETAKRNDCSLLELSGGELRDLLDGVTRRLPPYKADKHSLLRTMLRKTDEVTTTLSGWHWRLDTAENACLLTADTLAAFGEPRAVLVVFRRQPVQCHRGTRAQAARAPRPGIRRWLPTARGWGREITAVVIHHNSFRPAAGANDVASAQDAVADRKDGGRGAGRGDHAGELPS